MLNNHSDSVKSSYRRWTDEEINILKECYAKRMSREDIAKLLDRTLRSVAHKAISLGITRKIEKIKEFNENFFETPNIINSWIAGFIAADGCVYVYKRSNVSALEISLSNKDEDYLRKIANFLDVQRIKCFNRNGFKYCRFRLHCKKICDDLKKNFLITPRKTLTLEFPKHLTKKQKIAYLIGYIEGDGSIYSTENKRLCFNVLGTKKFLIDVRCFLFKQGLILKNEGNLYKESDANVYRLRYDSNQGKNILSRLRIFGICNKIPLMKRKWDKVKLAK